MGRLTSILAEPEVAARWPRYDRARVESEVLAPDEGGTVYVIEVDGAVAGLIQSHEEDDPEYRQAWIDIFVSTDRFGTGVAVDALRTLIGHLIGLGHHHLLIDPAADNLRAIACYRKVGFRDVGIMRRNEMGPDGTFHDALLMDLLAEDLA